MELCNVQVIDGDTIDADIDLGFDVFVRKRIRLLGINCPETRTLNLEEKKHGQESKQWLINKLKDQKIQLTHYEKSEKYGRVLGVLMVNGVNINEEMEKLGLGKVYFGGKRII